jgi:spore coat polysaccharide biosynthesis protein SpsF
MGAPEARLRRPVAVVQARMGSTRLPGKVLADLAGRPLLLRVVERARRARLLEEVVVATSDLPADDAIAELCAREGVPCFRGSEADVLDRYHGAAHAFDADPVVRLTADCPLLDPALVDLVLERYAGGSEDYVALAAGAAGLRLACYPSGFNVECCSRAALERASREATAPSDREHVTPYLWRSGRFRTALLPAERDLAHLHCSVDTSEDLELVRAVWVELGRELGLAGVLELFARRPELPASNARGDERPAHELIWEAA